MTTLLTQTPEELEAEALDLEKRAAMKESQADSGWATRSAAAALMMDAGYFRDEAALKRAKAERMRKALVTT